MPRALFDNDGVSDGIAGPAGPAGPAEGVDGRRARREKNRDAVVGALLTLYHEGNLDPSSDEIAGRAGLSARSLFRYFDDVDDLCRAAIERQHLRIDSLVDLEFDPSASLAERVRLFVEQRLDLFEANSGVGHVSRLRAPFQPLIAAELSRSRSYLRRQISRLFADELAEMGVARAGSALAAADVLCSFEAHDLLRQDQGLSRARAAGVLIDALTVLFNPAARPST
jgi:AcrR family transcriptional regulator